MTNGKAKTALILGIVGLFIPILPIIAFIYGILGLKASKELGEGRGMAITGIVLGALAFIGGFFVLPFIGGLAYFGVLSPDNMLPERTTFQAPLPAMDNALVSSDGTVMIPFMNNKGEAITLTGEAQGTQDCANIQFVEAKVDGVVIDSQTPIANGDTFIITFKCMGKQRGEQFDAGITFNYASESTGMERPHSGTVMATVA